MTAYPADSASLTDNERCCHCDFDNDDSASAGTIAGTPLLLLKMAMLLYIFSGVRQCHLALKARSMFLDFEMFLQILYLL